MGALGCVLVTLLPSPRATPGLVPADRAYTTGDLVAVSAGVPGTVLRVRASEGRHVGAGTVLVELDPAPYKTALVRAQARLAAAQARVRAAVAALAANEQAAGGGVTAVVASARRAPPVPARPETGPLVPDPATAAQAREARRQLAAAEAAVLRAAQAQVEATQQTVERDRALLAQGLIAAREIENDSAAYDAARAQAAAAEAAVRRTRSGAAPAPAADVDTPRAATQDPEVGTRRAQAALAAAQAQARAARADVAATQRVADRDAALLAQGAIAAQQVRSDTMALTAAQARAAAAQAAVRQAEADLATAQTRAASAQAARREIEAARRAEEARRQQIARTVELARQAEAAIAEARQRARALAAAQAQVIDAESAVQTAEANLVRTVIRAPVDGWVAHSAAVPGQPVRAGQSLMSLSVPGHTSVVAEVARAQAVRARAGDPARVTIGAGRQPSRGAPAGGSDPARARRERLSRIADQEQRNLAQLAIESARIKTIILGAAPGGAGPRGPSAGPTPTLLSGALAWPVSGEIASGFGWRVHPIFHTPEFHTGVDIAASFGTPVLAPADGIVVFTGSMPANGMLVILDHGHGLSTTYSHLSVYTVRPGGRVRKGDVIGRVGSTGWSTGPHLFFEIRRDGQPVDPLGR